MRRTEEEEEEEEEELYSRKKSGTMFFGKSRLVFIANLIRCDLLLWETFHLSKVPTVLIDLECVRSTFPYM